LNAFSETNHILPNFARRNFKSRNLCYNALNMEKVLPQNCGPEQKNAGGRMNDKSAFYPANLIRVRESVERAED